MVGKQFSISVINLATSTGTSRRNSAIATTNESTVEQRKHALSEENLPSMVMSIDIEILFLFCKYLKPSISFAFLRRVYLFVNECLLGRTDYRCMFG
jgi:hypothetical protein